MKALPAEIERLSGRLGHAWSQRAGWVGEVMWRTRVMLGIGALAIFPLLVLAALNYVMLASDQGDDILRHLRDPLHAWQKWIFLLCAAYLGLSCGMAGWLACSLESRYNPRPALSADRDGFVGLTRNTVVLLALVLAVIPTLVALYDRSIAGSVLFGILVALALNVLLFGFLPHASQGFKPLVWVMRWLPSTQSNWQQLVVRVAIPLASFVGLNWLLEVAIVTVAVASFAAIVTFSIFGSGGLLDWFGSQTLRPVGNPAWWFTGLLLVGLVGFVLVSYGPRGPMGRDWTDYFGAPAIIMLAFGFWAMVLTLAVVVPTQLKLSALVVLVGVATWMHLGLRRADPHRVDLVQAGLPSDAHRLTHVATARADFDLHVQAWLSARAPAAGARLPVYFVAAEGGGIRAAYWTALVLSRLHVETAGQFTDQTFAISSVSGGSVGAAAFVAALAERRASDAACSQRPIAFTPDDRVRLLRVLERDHLAPIVGAMVYGDALRALLPGLWWGSDRAYHFERSLASAFSAEFAGSVRMDRPFADLWADDTECLSVPSLLINTTDASTGKRVVLSDLGGLSGKLRDATLLAAPLRPEQGPCALAVSGAASAADLPLKSVAHLSARFPYISPAGSVTSVECGDDGKPREVERQLVDGGYFDNSGAASLHELMAAFADAAGRAHCGQATCADRIELRAVLIENDPDAPSYMGRDDPMRPASAGRVATALDCSDKPAELATSGQSTTSSQWAAPVNAFWKARSARGSLAKDELGSFVHARGQAARAACASGALPGACAAGASIVSFSIARGLCSRSQGSGADADMVTPPLGWVLSGNSQQLMRTLACNSAWVPRLQLRTPVDGEAMRRAHEQICGARP